MSRKRKQHVWYSSNDTGTQIFTNSVSEELLLQIKPTPEIIEFGRNLLKKLGLYQFKDFHPATLSGGQKTKTFYCLCINVRKKHSFV